MCLYYRWTYKTGNLIITKRISNFDSAGRFRAFNYVSQIKENTCKYLQKEKALAEFLEIHDKNQRRPFYKELHY